MSEVVETSEPTPGDLPSEDGSIAQRRSRWASSKEALSYLFSALGDKKHKGRTSDTVTTGLLTVAILVGSSLVLFPQAASILVLLSSILFLVTTVFYLANRLGVLTTLNTRQLVIVAELMFGFTALGILLLVNVQACLWLVRNLIILSSS